MALRGTLLFLAGVAAGLALAAIVVLCVIVPRFEAVFDNFGVDLPPSLKALIALSHFAVKRGWIVIVLALGVITTYWMMGSRKA